MLHSISSHNGCLTITNTLTGNHRTFRIRTQNDPAGFAPGERIVSLLTGPDNTSDYTGFGFVKDNGKIVVWRKYRGQGGEKSAYEKYADLLMYPEHYEQRGFVYEFSIRCRKCNRELTTSESIASGIGPICARSQAGQPSLF